MKEMLTITDPEVEVGPGKYNQMNATHSLKNLRTRGGVIGTARKYEIEVNENPSPGQYHKHQYRNTARCVSIGRANLNESIRSDIIPMGNFGFINKNVINSSQLGPDLGPGSYNTLDVKLAGKTVKNPMKGAHSFQKQLKYMENAKSVTSLSGPGDYNLKIDCLNLSKYANTRTGGAIGKSGVKTDRFSWDTVEGPDPGKYQNNASFIMSPKNVKFGRSSK